MTMTVRRLAMGLIVLGMFAGVAEAASTPAPRQPTADGMGTAPEGETKTPAGNGAANDTGAGQVTRTARPLPDPEAFQTPTGNIGCVYTPAGGSRVYMPADGGPELSCDIVQPRYIRATLSARGPGVLSRNVSDQGCCGGFVLQYGETWTAGPFRCTSERTGLSCERHDGHGMFLSRRRIEAQ
ncbi:hypothetical protein SAMN05880582_1011675 [Rhizobium sp. RU20A]|uniref:hypothetical protein n=1 Tax=Rhizobium sp. RU20A TaxID=1907412 RepID=UPI0009547757|nr:hypothetical protein [Rhizobium sp. RU20A]SIQ38462.1 hypothetical protein SAMN05880582_1011675 [Rhizobium sp. RU20A]